MQLVFFLNYENRMRIPKIVGFSYQISNSWWKPEYLDSVITADKNPNPELMELPQGLLGAYVKILCMLKSSYL